MCCPSCSSENFVSNWLEEAPFAAAAQYAPQLRRYGDNAVAVGVLGALGLVRLTNSIRPRWRCLECGARFDD
ncbi:hypothetical protein P1X14_12315 [Sphingomonas sp. AOB5]|uniref:hypothetical protein n=1 Tax=Sphingomonas sp. AOB5 TaxID=3034017 RepID=UPI0023F89AE2|nr:hypothetical protein [Sphingomonas sp. AOB5]MDF7776034.1 hypothetical protein [Sphingomonas sp. AOB5]